MTFMGACADSDKRLRPCYSGQKAPGRPPALKSEPGPPITLGSAAEAGVRLIVWRRDCVHQIEPDPAGQEIVMTRR
jgi:hypothetical protein